MSLRTRMLAGAGAATLATTLRAAPSDELRALAESVQARCFECHAAAVTKGGLALDTAGGWVEGVDGLDPEDSELFYRVTLPADDPDAMPPKGPRLSRSELSALQAWIREGSPAKPLEQALSDAAKGALSRAALLDRVREASGARIDERPNSVVEDEAQLLVTWSFSPEPPTPARMAALEPVAHRVIELSLAGLEGPVDEWLSALPELPAIRRVHLERSPVTNGGVAALLKRSPVLDYLNLHSTRVDRGVLDLDGLPEGAQLVLFGTDAFKASAALVDPFASVARTYPRRILAADASKGRVALLMETAIGKPTVLWEAKTRAIHDLQWLGDTQGGHGRVLYQESWQRVVEVDTATGRVLWSYEAPSQGDDQVEIHSFERLKDGTTMVAESGRARIAFVDSGGAVVHSFQLQVDTPDAHHDTRQVQPTSTGTFLVAHERDGVIREYDRDGTMVWSYAVPPYEHDATHGEEQREGFGALGNQAYSALRLQDGNTVIATGNGHSFLCVDASGEIRWVISQDSLESVQLAWTTTIQELSNGHLVLGNCHAGPDQPQAVEVDAAGRIHWRFRDFDRFGNALTGFEVIER
ncbi:MAG: PQQ-binding-like beta-propeller repeat protein [Planctomycetota bacterium]